MTADFIALARRELHALADPVKAPQMQRYMKSTMPFLGVATPQRRAVANQLCKTHVFATQAELVHTARELWRTAEYREERYLALTITGHKANARLQDPGMLDLYEEFIVSGAWWDLVDETASRRIGPLLRSHPETVRPVVMAWATDGDRWKRRTSVICQLGSRERTDLELLRHSIESNLRDPDFFLRKGIGWALREHSKTDAAWVLRFVDDHPNLSPLSRREALRRIGA